MPESEMTNAQLVRLALRAGLLTLVGRGAAAALRLATNLVLTRLLVPEAFGLMALVQLVMQGVRMFSDVGTRGSVVRDPRGDDPVFLNTAWTIQIVRGFGIFVAVALLAWPAATFYAAPELKLLMRVVAVSAILDGFASTAIFTLIRHVRPGPQIARELVGQCAFLAVAVVWAQFSRTAWALVWAGLATSALTLVLSHRLIPGYRNRPRFDREAARSITRFGRWILLATAMAFLASQADRLVIGKLMTPAEFGVYSIAYFLAQFVPELTQLIAINVLFPVYARLAQLEPRRERRELARYRVAVLSCALPPLWFLTLFGVELVGFLYDPRYADAGWMVQILAVGMIGSTVSLSAERVLLARGDSFSHMILQACQATLLLGSMWLGAELLGGVRGLLVGVSTGRLLAYVPLAILIRRHGVWLPVVDVAAFGISLAVIGAGLAITDTL